MRYALVKQSECLTRSLERTISREFLICESMHIRRQPDICWFVTETVDSAEAPHSQYAEGYPF